MLAILAESALRSLLLGGVVWIGLNLFRVRNPHMHMTSWAMVLLASLSMPLLMHWTTVSITVDVLPVLAPDKLWLANHPLNSPFAGPLAAEPLGASLPPEPGISVAPHADSHAAVNWVVIATAIYACVAGLLLLRLAIGLCLTWRLARAAVPMREPWTAGWRVRVSDVIGGPVTFGSTILLPPQYIDWDLQKRRAVLAHEGAHVANRDFHVLLLASLNRAVFWFSPLAWWQLTRLAELAEIISDARALEVLEDRLSYAEILLDLARQGRPTPAGLAMARACTVRARVERILAATADPANPGWRTQIWAAAAILPVVVVSAGSIAYSTTPAPTPVIDGAADATMAVRQPEHAAFYSLGQSSIFAISREGNELFGQLSGQRKVQLAAAGGGTYSYPAADGKMSWAVSDKQPQSELVLNQNGHELRAIRVAELSGQGVEADAGRLDSYVGSYALSPIRVLSVTRDGDRLHVRESGRPRFEVAARGVDAFAGIGGDLVIFLRDGTTKITQILLQEPLSGARLAPRISAARAKMMEEEFARRIAEVPDRFREQAPLQGSREAILRGIDDLQRGAPDYDRMSASLAVKARRQVSELETMLKAFGAVESIFFRGVGPGGYDIYGVKFANGVAEIRLLLGADGKADDVIFRPDGNDTLGGVVGCSDEPGLRSKGVTAPIRMLIYNGSGSDVQLFRLDAEGKRLAHGAIGEDMSSPVTTYVDSPWVVTDASGKCLEIVMPGQRTRYHTVGGARPGSASERAVSPRSVPLAGSEQMLRQYIEAMGRGEPNYDRMTAEVAAQTRRQLPFDQAILSRLGALRAISFRGVSALGSDIYIAHFANGSAEWRIGLVKDGTIGRIALGPQY